MSKVFKTMLIVAFVVVLLVGAVAVYAGNGSGRGTSSEKSNGQSTRAADSIGTTAREACDEDCTEEAYAVEAGNGYRNGDGGIISDYADLTGVDKDDVIDDMRDSDLDIWELAEQEGNFEALKAILLADLDEHIAVETDSATLAELIAHRADVAAATTAAEMPEDYDGYESAVDADGGRFGQNR